MTKPTALIFGVANEQSLAWAIARELVDSHRLILCCQSEKIANRVAQRFGKITGVAVDGTAVGIHVCDLEDDSQVRRLFDALQIQGIEISAMVHSVAYADARTLQRELLRVDAAQFHQCMHISVYSLIELLAMLHPLLADGASVLTMSYHGAVKVVPNYHLMGIAKAALESAVRYLAVELGQTGQRKIRINAISAGPLKTLASSVFPNMVEKLELAREKSPLRENIQGEDVAAMAAFLLGNRSRHMTGGVYYVDAGLNILGM